MLYYLLIEWAWTFLHVRHSRPTSSRTPKHWVWNRAAGQRVLAHRDPGTTG